MAWDFETDPEFAAHLEWMRTFIDTELIPLEPIYASLPPNEWAAVKRHLQDQVKARGLWGAFLDPKLGGAGFGQLKLALMSEIIGRCMMSMAIFGVQAPDSGNMELLAHGANDAQKERWLWPNLRGEISSAFALTEPFHAGADPTVIGTTATRDGDEWVLDGHKWFITNASVADIILVFAETNPEGRPHKHASVFVVPTDTPGLEIVRDIGTMSHPEPSYGRVGNHAELIFRNCRVPADHLIGAPGQGFVLAQQRLGGGLARPNARSTSCANARCRAPRTASCSRNTRWCRTTSRCRTWRFKRRAYSRFTPRGRWTSTAGLRCARISA
jgi:acyl-CoA dehydrogenase